MREVLTFIDFWKQSSAEPLNCLVFDSKFTTYQNLSQINQDRIMFITLRRRGSSLIQQVYQIPKDQWSTVTIDNPKRKHSSLKVNESEITLKGYDGPLRQLIVTNHGPEKPSFIITNDFDKSVKELILIYARRWLVEKSIAEQIEFFHLNLLGSSIVVKVDFDLTMTLLAYSLYKILAKHLAGFEKSTARNLFFDFVDNGADVEIIDKKMFISLRKKVHNTLIFESDLFNKSAHIPWVENLQLVIKSHNSS